MLKGCWLVLTVLLVYESRAAAAACARLGEACAAASGNGGLLRRRAHEAAFMLQPTKVLSENKSAVKPLRGGAPEVALLRARASADGLEDGNRGGDASPIASEIRYGRSEATRRLYYAAAVGPDVVSKYQKGIPVALIGVVNIYLSVHPSI
jgi:hypothetical protein